MAFWILPLNLWHLEVFREVMLTNSVTRAARNLGRTQPAVSASIAALERYIGYELFERRRGRLHPAPEAHFLLAEARQILDHIGTLKRAMRNASGAEAGGLATDLAGRPITPESGSIVCGAPSIHAEFMARTADLPGRRSAD